MGTCPYIISGAKCCIFQLAEATKGNEESEVQNISLFPSYSNIKKTPVLFRHYYRQTCSKLVKLTQGDTAIIQEMLTNSVTKQRDSPDICTKKTFEGTPRNQ